MTRAGERTKGYRERERVRLREQPRYLQRKRGAFVRLNCTLPVELVEALRSLVAEEGGSLSSRIERAVWRDLNREKDEEA